VIARNLRSDVDVVVDVDVDVVVDLDGDGDVNGVATVDPGGPASTVEPTFRSTSPST
jgi:hypothetical protein